MTNIRLLGACSLCLAVAGCDVFRTVASCDASINRAVDVEVTDARTGHWIAGGAFGVIREGAYLDSLKVVGGRGTPPSDTATTLGAGLGRAGTYDVQVEHAGYRTWRRTGVRASVGTCSVETARLSAALEAL